MKLRVPEGCGAISHRGRALYIAEDYSIEVDDNDWPLLSAHGLTVWEEGQDAPEVAEMTRQELTVAVINATSRALQTMSTDEMRARLTASEASVLPFETKSDAAAAVVETDVEAISALNRQGLFAFLRGKGVSVSLPVTNDGLRALARQTLGLT